MQYMAVKVPSLVKSSHAPLLSWLNALQLGLCFCENDILNCPGLILVETHCGNRAILKYEEANDVDSYTPQ